MYINMRYGHCQEQIHNIFWPGHFFFCTLFYVWFSYTSCNWTCGCFREFTFWTLDSFLRFYKKKSFPSNKNSIINKETYAKTIGKLPDFRHSNPVLVIVYNNDVRYQVNSCSTSTFYGVWRRFRDFSPSRPSTELETTNRRVQTQQPETFNAHVARPYRYCKSTHNSIIIMIIWRNNNNDWKPCTKGHRGFFYYYCWYNFSLLLSLLSYIVGHSLWPTRILPITKFNKYTRENGRLVVVPFFLRAPAKRFLDETRRGDLVTRCNE